MQIDNHGRPGFKRERARSLELICNHNGFGMNPTEAGGGGSVSETAHVRLIIDSGSTMSPRSDCGYRTIDDADANSDRGA